MFHTASIIQEIDADDSSLAVTGVTILNQPLYSARTKLSFRYEARQESFLLADECALGNRRLFQ